jgi:1-acyl-sn-glycerol-3-phosphate acyltransferase
MFSKLLSIFRFIIRGLALVVFLLFFLIPISMRVDHHRKKGTDAGKRKADRIAVGLGRKLARLFGIRVEHTGQPVEGAVLFVANHISWLDIPVLHAVCAMGFVAKAEIADWPIFSFIARTGGTIFHQRGSHDSAAGVHVAMAERLAEDRAVTVFPEGGIKPGSDVRVFHARMFRAAVETGCPVQPVSLCYLRDGKKDDAVSFLGDESMLVNLLRHLARPASVARVAFLPPMEAAGQPRRQLANAARAAVVDSLDF